MSEHIIRFTVNGVRREQHVAAQRRLIDVLRDDCGLTGTKEGCSVGICGACSVLVDGEVISSCLLPARICTPGQLITATALLAAHPRPTDTQIDEWMTSNLCRCTGYHGIRRAIHKAAVT
ncbi:MAG: 2Fe-2S iron-sulfur cluster binding domain-containing protein [Chloroflexi bacterium]|nr:MAG: 2Fe-2S iron-sulfur cluster binding domain-containing protein [Chloroflexota bacterium]